MAIIELVIAWVLAMGLHIFLVPNESFLAVYATCVATAAMFAAYRNN